MRRPFIYKLTVSTVLFVGLFASYFATLDMAWIAQAKPNKIPTWVNARIAEHKDSYAPKPQRGAHLDIKVTPPEIRGKEGKVLVEVYNRSKEHLSLVTFDLKLMNQGGYDLDAPIQAEDLRPNLSGGQWVKIPQVQGKFPKIIGARASNIKMITVDSREISLMPYLDVIKY